MNLSSLSVLAILFTFPQFSYSQENCADCKSKDPENIVETQSIEQVLSSNKRCTPLDELLLNEAKQEYAILFPNALNPEKQTQNTILDRNICGSSEELQTFTNLTQELKKTPVAWAQCPKIKNCISLQCALLGASEKNLEIGLRHMNLAKRENYVPLLLNSTTETNFNLREIRTIDETIKNLPAPFKKLPTLQTLRRVRDGYARSDAQDAAAVAQFQTATLTTTNGITGEKTVTKTPEKGEITFFEDSFNSTDEWLKHTITHEMAHHLDYAGYFSKNGQARSESSGFWKVSGWSATESIQVTDGKKTLVQTLKRDSNFPSVTLYGNTHPKEDFAESIAEYLIDPERLQKIDPKRYDLLKDRVFSGKEFKSNNPKKEEFLKKLLATRSVSTLKNCLKLLISTGKTDTLGVTLAQTKASTQVNIFSLNRGKTGADLAEMMVQSPLKCAPPIKAPLEFESDPDFCRNRQVWIPEAEKRWQSDVLGYFADTAIQYQNLLNQCKTNKKSSEYCTRSKDFLWDQIKKSSLSLNEKEKSQLVEVLYEKIQ